MYKSISPVIFSLLIPMSFLLAGCPSGKTNDCPAGEIRRDGNCLKLCNDSTMCEEGEVCFSGLCMDPGVGTCGDGVLNDGEECDNGASNNDTAACTSKCKQATCGDLLVQESVEQCDDGNTDDETACAYGTATCKGCSASCATLTLTGSFCGDGTNDAEETCDDGNTVAETACAYGNATCTPCNADCSAELSLTGSYCGDGTNDAEETCDDSNTVAETACTYGNATCTSCNADCSAELSLIGAYCGDDTTNGLDGEACDDGNTTTETNCGYGSPNCTVCDAICSAEFNLTNGRYCGDGTDDAEEACDDGNTDVETACAYGTPSCTPCNADCSATLSLTGSYCGDGTTDGGDGEACDDGNTQTESACSGAAATCAVCDSDCSAERNLMACGGSYCDSATHFCNNGTCTALPTDWTCNEAVPEIGANGTLTGPGGGNVIQVTPDSTFTMNASNVSASACPTCMFQYYLGLFAGTSGDSNDPKEGCSAAQSLGDGWNNSFCQNCTNNPYCTEECLSSQANATCFCNNYYDDNSGGSYNFSYNFTYTAPTAPGLYLLKQGTTSHYRCVGTGGGTTLGAVCVGNP
jgi:hypothetical protein